jgi:cytidylate kinase
MTVVAIDGPAGAGKSTVAREVARALGYRYLDSGAMYRAVALQAIERSVDVADHEGLATLAHAARIELDDDKVLLDGTDVTERIRDGDVTSAVSKVSAHPHVRAALVDTQRAVGEKGNVVVEGRDIGSAVFPDADVKVFLTASLDERARRRAVQRGAATDDGTIERVAADIAARDAADSGRAVSPLVQAPDAVVVDSTGRPIEDVVAEIVALVRSRT